MKQVVADKGKNHGKRGKYPEVVIPIRPTPDVTAMATSDMATEGSDSEEIHQKIATKSKEKHQPTG